MKESATDLTDQTDQQEDKRKLTAEGAESAEGKGPKLSDEQREWLNTVFIPNFRAELMRTLELKGSLRKQDEHKHHRQKMKDTQKQDGTEGICPTPAAEQREEDPTTKAAAATEKAAEEAASTGSGQGVEQEGLTTGDTGSTGRMARLAPRESSSREVRGEGAAGAERTDKAAELVAENARLRAALAETRVEQELVWAAAQLHAINAAQVAKLMKDQVRLDNDLEPVVVDGNGDRVADAHGRPMTVADAVGAFLDENPHLVRPTGPLTGGGSGGTDATALTGRTPALTGGELIAEALRAGA